MLNFDPITFNSKIMDRQVWIRKIYLTMLLKYKYFYLVGFDKQQKKSNKIIVA